MMKTLDNYCTYNNVPTTIKLPYRSTEYVKGLALDACIFSHILSKILDFFGWVTKFYFLQYKPK